MKVFALSLNLLHRPPGSQPAEISTCSGQLQIPLHKGFPLLLEELARDETSAPALDVTGLRGEEEEEDTGKKMSFPFLSGF